MVLYYGLRLLSDYMNNGVFDGPNWNETIFIVSQCLFLYILYNLNIFLVTVGPTDFKRKFVACKILGSMLNPVKPKGIPYLSNFPTINLADSRTLDAWLSVRLALLEFGRKYTLRVQLYCSTFFAVYAFIAIYLCLTWYVNQEATLTP